MTRLRVSELTSVDGETLYCVEMRRWFGWHLTTTESGKPNIYTTRREAVAVAFSGDVHGGLKRTPQEPFKLFRGKLG